ncbi:MAG: GatB/YqeY domain-containing protein [Alphaproteobacteria bacterium]|nr:GatB/YqeY domain-containing protein [Alphaproteobacteria bacterium]
MLRQTLKTALSDSMRAKDKNAVATLRLILAALKDREIAARSKSDATEIGDGEIESMLQTMVKQRRESIEMYVKGDRQELADKEAEEITVIERFLPNQLSDGDVEKAVAAVVADLGAQSLKDMGRVMGTLRERHAGQMDFGKAGSIAKKALSQ